MDRLHNKENNVYYDNTIWYGYHIINDLSSFLHYYIYIKNICDLVK